MYTPMNGSTLGLLPYHRRGRSARKSISRFRPVSPLHAMNRIRQFLQTALTPSGKRRGTNFIVVRHSPDWLSFDPEASRAFCVQRNLPETLVIDFIAIWNAAVAVDYRHFRFRIREIAQQTLVNVAEAEIITDAALRALVVAGKIPPDALVVFIDDDDWLAPHLFARLREFASVDGRVDGFRWGLVRLGRDRYSWGDAETNFASRPTLTVRPIEERQIYTNGYAVSGAALGRLGVDAVCEHFDAETQYQAGRFAPVTVPEHLSCANKHPAHTMAAHALLGSEEYRRDLRADIRRWAEGVMAVPLPVDLAWMAAPRDQLMALLADAARS